MNTTIKNIFLRTLLCVVLSLAWVGVKAQTYTYTIYFVNTDNWSSVNGGVFTSGNNNNWDWQTTYTNQKLTETDSEGRYILSFSTTEDLSVRSDVYCQFFTDDWSSTAGYFSFVDGATYDVNGQVTDAGGSEPPVSADYIIYFNTYGGSNQWWGSNDNYTLYVQVYSIDASGSRTYYTNGYDNTGSPNWDTCTWWYDGTFYWSYNGTIPDGALVEFHDTWGNSYLVASEFENNKTYTGDDAFGTDPIIYQTTYNGTDISTVKIVHKEPKWCSMTDVSHDTFNPDGWTTTLDNSVEIQATNIYVDTIYVMKGSDIELTLPYSYGNGVSTTAYQRWFDLRTDGNYRCGEDADLLMPERSEGGYTTDIKQNYVYRFANGYVSGHSLNDNMPLLSASFHYPTDSEFNEYTKGTDGYIQQTTNDYYVVACDVSQYNDFQNFGQYDWSTGYDWTEPTLSGRAIYYIVGVDPSSNTAPATLPDNLKNMWRLLESGYTGGTNNGNEKYLEEYEITYPARRTSNHTLELVTLSKDARAYVVPGVNDTSTYLNVKFDGSYDYGNADGNGFIAPNIEWADDGTGAYVEMNVLRDDTRVIHFYNTSGDNLATGSYSSDAASYGAPWKVADGTTATILVTKTVNGTTYNIARYKLTFKEDVTPLTQVQLSGLGTDEVNNSNYWWKDMTYRRPSYMSRNLDLITSLNFDYGPSSDAANVLNGQSGFHAFPMDWENTSYAFYDGSYDVNADGYAWVSPSGEEQRRIYTQWCMYSLVNYYFGYGDTADKDPYRPSEKPGQGIDDEDYWLYIDASDRPGSVAEIAFEDPICTGTQVFATALIKSAAQPTSDDAGVLFSIVGVDADGNHTTIYSQCSSQIRTSTYLNAENDYDENWTGREGSYWPDVDENGLDPSVTGKGEGQNEWFQLYFSFYSTERQNFDHYALKIDSYCSSTTGGDYYIDDIELYIVQPEFIVEQIAPICTTDDEDSAVRLMVDFATLEARMGDTVADEDKNAEDNSDDIVAFMIIDMSKYNNYFSENTSASPNNSTDVADAIKASEVKFVTGEGEDDYVYYMTLKFYKDDEYTDYPVYNGGDRVAGENTSDISKGYFFLYTVDGEEYLAIDCHADISPYKAYKILLLDNDNVGSISDENYATLFAECVEGTCEIASDFYLTSSTILKVNGEAVDPTVDYCAGQTVVIWPEVTYTASDGTTVTLGDEYFDWFFGTEEEYTEENATYEVSLQDALLMFRHFYPTATELDDSMKNRTDDEGNTFTEDMYDIIAYYLGQTNEGSSHAQLVLYQQKFNVVIPTTELNLVVQPIDVVVTDESGEPVEDICFGYVPLTLSVGGNAPTLNAGFHNVVYPGDDFVPNIRLGLSQVNQASQAKSGSNTQTPITVNLRNAKYYYEDEETEATHLGVYTSEDGTMNGLYLVGTNDPAYEEALSDDNFYTQYDLPIGKVLDLYAIEDDTNGSSYMTLAFYDDYTLREGYSYIVLVNCEEKDANGASVNGVCQGSLPIELKIVPEYLVWQGNTSSNWNDDSNWLRADKNELKKPNTDTYPTNEENETDNGLVPMLFSKVVIPEGKTAELYMAGFKESSSQFSWTGDEDTATHDDVTDSPTENIMYDLMVYDKKDSNSGAVESMKTERYRVNLCRQLHLAPGAQLLHSELLIVDTVWTEVKIPQGEWQLVATPLDNVYAGDWYTKRATSTETAEYFTNITFDGYYNNRYDPDIYQRSWDKAGTIVASNSSDNRSTPAYESTGWTSAYNDASESFTSGLGFSLEGWSSAVNSTDSIMFRFPKADTSYDYSTGTLDDNHGTGTLLISSLVDRTDPDEDMKDGGVYKEDEITITLPENTIEGNNYYLIGNPFTAPMSMAQFMAANTDIKGYWTESDLGPVAGDKEKNSWGTEDVLIPPYTAFFVTTSESDISPMADEPLTVSFTKDMQTMSIEDNRNAPTKFFAIRATNSVGTSGASLSYDENATDGYDATEDVILLEDDSWKREGMPMVYTVAGDMAVSINTLSTATTIPIGAFADDDCTYTLTFVGTDNLIEPVLYDAYALTETPLTEGFTLSLTGASHGQYFIRVAAPTPTGITEDYTPVYDITAYSPTQGTIIVSSSAALENVDVYSVGGMLLRQVNASGNISCTINGINSGVAIVRARTSEGTFVKKLRVR